MKWIDAFLNKVTMYNYMLYYLIVLIVAAVALSYFGVLSYNAWLMAVGAAVVYGACKLWNWLFGYLFKVWPNWESSAISGVILGLIVGPEAGWNDIWKLVFVAGVAMLSKFVIVWRKRHIFNPAAFAVVVSALTIGLGASWWVGTKPMIAFVVIGGLLFLRKIRWFHLWFSFLLTYCITIAVLYFFTSAGTVTINDLGPYLLNTLLYSPVLFFSFVMLTEPLTMPGGRNHRIVYGVLIGLLAAVVPAMFNISYALELSLLIGNVVALILFGNTRRFAKFLTKQPVAANTIAFAFAPNQPLPYQPGQFLLWTLPHKKTDFRGHRRYFSIASSPTENSLALVTKFAERSSSFKNKLQEIPEGYTVTASNLDGDFVLPRDEQQPLVFIAGGVGVVPFRSMIKYLVDKEMKRPITLFYSNNREEEIAFKDLLTQAEQAFGLKTIYTLTDKEHLPAQWAGKTGYVDAEMITSETPDYKSALYYISGPDPMVRAMEKTLHSIGIARRQIKTDYFPGYV